MKLDEYQQVALSTAKAGMGKVYPTLGLTGEAGEVAEKVKKVLRDQDGVFTADTNRLIALELGDVLWYLSTLAYELGYTLEAIAQMNIDKLASRKERGVMSGSGDLR